jgi:hypothetical protein
MHAAMPSGRDMPRRMLLDKARKAIAEGRLPPLSSPRFWGGMATSFTVCALCELPIATGHSFVHLESDPAVGPRFHGACHYAWHEACAQIQQSRSV